MNEDREFFIRMIARRYIEKRVDAQKWWSEYFDELDRKENEEMALIEKKKLEEETLKVENKQKARRL